MKTQSHIQKKAQRRLEQEFLKEERLEAIQRREDKFQEALKTKTTKIGDVHLTQFVNGVCHHKVTETRADVEDFVHAVQKKCPKLLLNENHRKFSNLLYLYHHSKIETRPPSSWVPAGKSRHSLFKSLVDHCVVKYPVPLFLYKLLEDDNRAYLPFFSHLTSGGSMVKAVKARLIPVPLTKKMCHEFLQAPADFNLVSAARRAQVKAFGGDARLIHAISNSFLRDFAADNTWEDFYMTVIQWFSSISMLDYTQVAPLLDFIRYKKNQDVKFAIAGRSPLAMMREMQQWHGELQKAKAGQKFIFLPSGYKNGRWEEANDVVWDLMEIVSAKDLAYEGKVMHHCVFSYARMIEQKAVSIWSLMKTDSTNGTFKHLTIELNNATRRIVQARGIFNRAPTPQELSYLNRWATINGLQLCIY